MTFLVLCIILGTAAVASLFALGRTGNYRWLLPAIVAMIAFLVFMSMMLEV